MKTVLAICGSASPQSSCLRLLQLVKEQAQQKVEVEIWDDLKSLPHFDAEQTIDIVPEEIKAVRNKIEQAGAVIICSPEYVFSIPAGIKNLLEWCVATRVFASKPCALITAAASGQKAHQDLQLVLRTIEADLPEERCLLLNGIKGKLRQDGSFSDTNSERMFVDFCEYMTNFSSLSESH